MHETPKVILPFLNGSCHIEFSYVCFVAEAYGGVFQLIQNLHYLKGFSSKRLTELVGFTKTVSKMASALM